jgi:hypothetical protein
VCFLKLQTVVCWSSGPRHAPYDLGLTNEQLTFAHKHLPMGERNEEDIYPSKARIAFQDTLGPEAGTRQAEWAPPAPPSGSAPAGSSQESSSEALRQMHEQFAAFRAQSDTTIRQLLAQQAQQLQVLERVLAMSGAARICSACLLSTGPACVGYGRVRRTVLHGHDALARQ